MDGQREEEQKRPTTCWKKLVPILSAWQRWGQSETRKEIRSPESSTGDKRSFEFAATGCACRLALARRREKELPSYNAVTQMYARLRGTNADTGLK